MRRKGASRVAALGLTGLLIALAAGAQDDESAGCPQACAAADRVPVPKPELATIPVQGAGDFGADLDMRAQVYRPAGSGPFPVLVFSHGRVAGGAVARARFDQPVPKEQVRFWLERGFAVVAPIRPGYGATGGADRESSGARNERDGRCTSQPDFQAIVRNAVRSVSATLAWLRGQPWADTRRIVLEGQSVGGLTTVAAAAAQPEGVIASINFAGGAGGDPRRAPGRSCDPDGLTAIYTALGRTTRVPNLWIYAANDQYWGADAPKAWHAAFAAGGSTTTFIQAPPVADGDGHGLSRHASALWAGDLDDFLKRAGVLGPS